MTRTRAPPVDRRMLDAPPLKNACRERTQRDESVRCHEDPTAGTRAACASCDCMHTSKHFNGLGFQWNRVSNLLADPERAGA